MMDQSFSPAVVGTLSLDCVHTHEVVFLPEEMGHETMIFPILLAPITCSFAAVRRMPVMRRPGMRWTHTHTVLDLKHEWRCALFLLMMGREATEQSIFCLENQI